jgi:Helix-turn-helix domain of resolvase
MPNDFRISIADAPAEQAFSPISMFTWLSVCKRSKPAIPEVTEVYLNPNSSKMKSLMPSAPLFRVYQAQRRLAALAGCRCRNLAERVELRRRINEGDKKAQLARDFGISRETLYQYLRAPV